ncbi:MAG: prepilin-type N-terminal cleavage/methylation domain-containing protein [Verrucomicrobiales bacterium]|jgi:prepilin-type N-terminal cleavage/methylation domain-containing protein|nr:prepilin-type N-terminal cleavage/methylation domain-containing protein [Verrucomicrobiales bacterium]
MKTNKRGFTLVELLVVITIIGILAGLAIPGITGVLDKAKQMADVANSKQVGLILFTVANDENGIYPIGAMNSDLTARVQAGTSVVLFNALISEGSLTDAKVLATNGCQKYLGQMGTSVNLLAANVGWDYVSGLNTSSSPRLPLLVSFGAYSALTEFSSAATLNATGSSAWKDKGVVVFTVGQSAEFVKATGGRVRALIDNSDATGLTTTYLKPGN